MNSFKPPSTLNLEGNVAENWRKWKQRFQLYMEASGTMNKPEKQRVAIFLHLIGEEALEIYNTFSLSTAEQKIEVLFRKFEEYCNPRRNITFERHKFFTCVQESTENIDQYVTELRTKASTCEFGELCESLIRDRIVCGISSNTLREKLLQESDLSLQKAIDMCRASELSKRQTKSITEDPKSVDYVNKKASPGSKFPPKDRKEKDRQQKTKPGSQNGCKRCGTVHAPRKCPAFGKVCQKCKNRNHFASQCKTKSVHFVESDQVARRVVEEEQSDNESEELFIDQVQRDSHEQDWKASLLVNNNMVEFKLDTGAQANVIPSDVFNSLKGMPQLGKTKAKLTGFNGSEIPVVGVAKMICKYKDKQINSDFFVVEAEGQPPLLGLRACQELSLIKFVRTVDTAHVNSPNSILDEFNDLFEGLGELEGEHHNEINPEVKPVIHPPRKVPFTLLPKLKQELERMEQLGAIEKVDQPTEWVNSIVIVEKPDGNLRICLDPKDLNRAVKREHFQLPTSTEITSKLTGAKVFSKLDAKDGFWHVKLDHPSSLLTTFNTPFGRFKFNRLPFGLNSSNEVFQKKMQFAFEGIEGAEVIYDDLLVWGRDEESHDRALRNVLERAREKGVKLKKQKCEIKIPEVVYIGDKITKDGIKPDESKIDAILNLPSPENKKDVERLLGMVTYLSKFIPNMSTLTEPLRALLKQDVQWHWEEQQEKALDEIKKVLTSKPVLCYYDVNKPVKLSVDASQSGLGAVLLQDNQPVAYASKSLTDCQKGYAQIEKETLAIVFGCERFHQYLYGKEVEIESDHKPLEAIFTKPIAKAPPRIQRLLLRLQHYHLKVKYVPGKLMFIADTLSRAHLDTTCTKQGIPDAEIEMQVHLLVANLPISEQRLTEFQEATKADPSLQAVAQLTKQGWPNHKKNVPAEAKPYWCFKEEIHEADGILFKGNKMIVPEQLRPEMLKRIHESHLGIEKSKRRARDILYWPNMNAEISELIANCSSCLKHRKNNTKEPLIPHEVPDRPWQKIACDLFTLGGKDYLLTVDYYSKWVEIGLLRDSTASSEVITQLKSLFARYGIPEEVISDNGPQFASRKFKQFAESWEFKHTTTSPTYPQANGQVEKTIGTTKSVLKKAHEDGTDPYIALLENRNTPITGLKYSPAQLFLNRRLKTKLPTTTQLLNAKIPTDARSQLLAQQKSQKLYFDRGAKALPPVKTGDAVRMKTSNGWRPATVTKLADSPRSVVVTSNGTLYRRNRRHIIKTPDVSKPTITSPKDDREITKSPGSDRNIIKTPVVTRSGRTVRAPRLSDFVYY